MKKDLNRTILIITWNVIELNILQKKSDYKIA